MATNRCSSAINCSQATPTLRKGLGATVAFTYSGDRSVIAKVMGTRLQIWTCFVLASACKTPGAQNASVQSAPRTSLAPTALGVEDVAADEAGYIQQLQDLTIDIMKMNQKKMGAPNPVRDVHTKTNGCVNGMFEIDPNLDSSLHTGVFQPGARYPVIIRMSPGAPGIIPDNGVTTRGLAMKLLQVDAVLDKYQVPTEERSWLLPQFAGLQQDFTFLNAEQFIIKDLSRYIIFTKELAKGNPLPAFINPNPFHPIFQPRELKLFTDEATQKVANLLGISYFGQLPYKFKDTAFKYRMDPCPSQKPLPTMNTKDPDYLRKAMTETLKGTTVCYAFSIILQKDANIQPIEDTTIAWPSSDKDIAAHKPTANRTEVGRLTIPPQDFSSDAVEQRCERLSFNPWNGLAAHKPLGNMSRARKAVYLAGAANRPSDRGVQTPDEEQLAILKKYSAYGLAPK